MIFFLLMYCRVKASAKKKAAANARLKKHREKVNSNPELLEEYRRKERERSGVRKVIKQVLSCVAVITLSNMLLHVSFVELSLIGYYT